jgi:hypothetical protein
LPECNWLSGLRPLQVRELRRPHLPVFWVGLHAAEQNNLWHPVRVFLRVVDEIYSIQELRQDAFRSFPVDGFAADGFAKAWPLLVSR